MARHWLFFFFLGALGAGDVACKGEESSPTILNGGEIPSRFHLDPAAFEKKPQTALRALVMPHRILAARLMAHKIVCKSTLVTRLPQTPLQQFSQEMTLRMDNQGHFAAVKNTHPQYGNEVIWTGDWLYPRLRYSKFVKRKARPGEPADITDRMYGLLPAYVRLLGRFISVLPAGKDIYGGREVIRVRLVLNPKPLSEATSSSALARQWRRTVVANSAEGQALLDTKTAVPLSVDLRARWSFNPPAAVTLPANGIPSSVDREKTGTTELIFSQRVMDLGRVASISPPPLNETIENPRRIRLEMERQMLSGELPVEPIRKFSDIPR